MSEVVATGVSTVTDIGSRLAAFSIAVTVPYSGRTTYSFSLEWDKKSSDVAYIPKVPSGSPDTSSQNTVKDSISSQTFPTMSNEATGEERTALLLRRAALIAKRKESEVDYKVKPENKRPSKHKNTASIANLEDCNRLVSVKLYLRHFRPDGEIEEKVFSGETVNVSTILDTLRFLLRNVKLPLMQHTLGRLFLLRDQFRGGRIDEMAYNTYRHMTLEEVQPQNDEHIFMLDLTDTFFDKQMPDLHHARM
uniref:Uncharacterized protein n=1 Tax=Ascaris lumbricoides TaxID=6252 RepID=A0A9J2P2A4_ASCLU